MPLDLTHSPLKFILCIHLSKYTGTYIQISSLSHNLWWQMQTHNPKQPSEGLLRKKWLICTLAIMQEMKKNEVSLYTYGIVPRMNSKKGTKRDKEQLPGDRPLGNTGSLHGLVLGLGGQREGFCQFFHLCVLNLVSHACITIKQTSKAAEANKCEVNNKIKNENKSERFLSYISF